MDRNVIASPVSFPTLRAVSSALYFGVTGAWDYRQRKSAAVSKSVEPQPTTGNILNVSYIVLRRWIFSSVPDQVWQGERRNMFFFQPRQGILGFKLNTPSEAGTCHFERGDLSHNPQELQARIPW